MNESQQQPPHLQKAATGISGFDEITDGGLPKGRITLVNGGPGCGKTTFAMQFLANGVQDYDEPGVYISFDETEQELITDFASIGIDLPALTAAGSIKIDYVQTAQQDMHSGDFDLEGLFIRLQLALDAVGAKRVVLDSVEELFTGLADSQTVQTELNRLFDWLKQRGMTTVLTSKQGENGRLTRHGLEEYLSDCVILLDQRVDSQITSRRLRILKYRGTGHGTNEYPFQISKHGLSILPITALTLHHQVVDERVGTGVAGLDTMLGGGYYRGSTILATGSAGTGKSTLATHFVDAACKAGERVLYFAFEESEGQIFRNMRSVGFDLQTHKDAGLLRLLASRPTSTGLEMHLLDMLEAIEEFAPQAVAIDPISSLIQAGDPYLVKLMTMRLVDFLKTRQITAICSYLTAGGATVEQTNAGISSLMDTWVLLRHADASGRRRSLTVVKSRGMAHDLDVRPYRITARGFVIDDALEKANL